MYEIQNRQNKSLVLKYKKKKKVTLGKKVSNTLEMSRGGLQFCVTFKFLNMSGHYTGVLLCGHSLSYIFVTLYFSLY